MRRPNWKHWLQDKNECKSWLDSYTSKKIIRKSSDNSVLHLQKTDHNLTFGNWIIEKHKDEIPEIFGLSKELREKACYDVHESFEKQLAQNINRDVVEFVNKVKFMIKEK